MPQPATAPDRSGSWTDFAVNMVVRGMIGLCKLLPYRARLRAFGGVTAHVLGPLAGFRRRAEQHLAFISPDMPRAERRRIATATLDNLGRTLIENYSPRDLARAVAESEVAGPGLAALQEAQAEGRPVLLVTGHFGNHEAPRHALVQRGLTIGGLYRPMSNPYFNAHYAETMTSLSGPVFAKGARGTMGFARFLKSGGIGVLLFDLFDQDGAEMLFMGQTALTSTSAAELALRFDAPLIPFWGRRQADGVHFDIRFDDPIPATDPVTMTKELTRRLEAQVAEAPEQWFWVHRRWKPERTAQILAQRA